MIRTVLRAMGPDGADVTDVVDVGAGFESFNAAIRADVGEVVYCLDGEHVLWCDEEGLLTGRPVNHRASSLAGRMIVGDVILMGESDLT